jgi:hypothetical protein
MKPLRLHDMLLVIGWIAMLGVAASALILLGYSGYLMILVWGAAAAPLAVLSARRLERRHLTLDPVCRRLALRSYALLTVATMSVPLALWVTASVENEGVGILAGFGFSILFAGQVGYVLAATYWMVREIALRDKQSVPGEC